MKKKQVPVMFKYKILHFNRNVLIKAVRLSSAEQTLHKTKNRRIY